MLHFLVTLNHENYTLKNLCSLPIFFRLPKTILRFFRIIFLNRIVFKNTYKINRRIVYLRNKQGNAFLIKTKV